MDHDHEIKNFIKVWIIAIASQGYCYYIAARIPTKNMTRFISLLPIFYLLVMLPFKLHSTLLGFPSALYLGCLAILRLLLFSFDSGPLSPPPARLSHFISIALLPIQMKQLLPNKPSCSTSHTITKVVPNKSSALWAIKVLVLGVVISACQDYVKDLHPYVNTALSYIYLYLVMEIGYAISVALPRALFGFEIESHFNEPYLSTSLQDFWGRRWNLVVTNLLRSIAYNPMRRILGPRWGSVLGVIFSFAISGLMHEVFFYYVTGAHPTGEMMCFFVLQGVCLVIEVAVKKIVAHKVRIHKVRIHPLVSGTLTWVFLIVTANWLFFPLIIRNGVDVKFFKELASIINLVKAKIPLYHYLSKT